MRLFTNTPTPAPNRELPTKAIDPLLHLRQMKRGHVLSSTVSFAGGSDLFGRQTVTLLFGAEFAFALRHYPGAGSGEQRRFFRKPSIR